MLITSEEVRNLGHLPLATGAANEALPESRVLPQRMASEAMLRKWVGDGVYDAAAALVTAARGALGVGENIYEDGGLSRREMALMTAEGYLCLAELMPGLNLIYSSPGIQTSVSAERGGTSALTPEQLEQLIKRYRRMAWTQAHDYLLTPVLVMGVSRAYDEAGNKIEG